MWMKKAKNFSLKVLISFCLIFCQFQPGVAYKNAPYRKSKKKSIYIYIYIHIESTEAFVEAATVFCEKVLFKITKI